MRKFIPVPGVSQVAVRPENSVGHGVHRLNQIALESEPGKVVTHGLPAEVDEGRHSSGRTWRSAVSSIESGSSSQVGAMSSRIGRELFLESLVRAPISPGEKNPRTAGASVQGPIRRADTAYRWTEENSAGPGRAAGNSRKPSLGDDLRRHQLKIGARGGTKVRTLGNGKNGPTAPQRTFFSSTTLTRRPDLASRAAATKPLCPAPTTITSSMLSALRLAFWRLEEGHIPP